MHCRRHTQLIALLPQEHDPLTCTRAAALHPPWPAQPVCSPSRHLWHFCDTRRPRVWLEHTTESQTLEVCCTPCAHNRHAPRVCCGSIAITEQHSTTYTISHHPHAIPSFLLLPNSLPSAAQGGTLRPRHRHHQLQVHVLLRRHRDDGHHGALPLWHGAGAQHVPVGG